MKALGLSPTEQVKLNLPDDRLIFHVLDKRNMLEKGEFGLPRRGRGPQLGKTGEFNVDLFAGGCRHAVRS